MIKKIIFIIFSVLCFIEIFIATPWRDVGQAWIIGRDLSLHDIFFIQTGVEGHPFLWFFILKPFTYIFPYMPTISIINSVFLVISAYLLVFKTKHSVWFTGLILFFILTTQEIFFSPRPYSLGVLIFLVLYLYFPKRFEKPILYTFFLAFAMQLTVVYMVIVGFFALFFYFEIYDNPKYNVPLSILLLSFLLGIYQVTLMFLTRGVINNFKFLSLLPSEFPLYTTILGLIIIFVIHGFFKKNKFSPTLPSFNKGVICISLLVALIIIIIRGFVVINGSPWTTDVFICFLIISLLLIKDPRVLILSLIWSSILIIGAIYPSIGLRQTAPLIILGLIWIYESSEYRIILPLFFYVFYIQANPIIEFINNIKNPISASVKLQQYIKDNGLFQDDYYLIALDSSLIASPTAYFKEKIFYCFPQGKKVSYTDWRYPFRDNSKLEEFVAEKTIYNVETKSLRTKDGKEIYFIYDMTPPNIPTYQWKKVFNGDGSVESIHIYQLQKEE